MTGIRQDAYAKAHPLQVEVEKAERERGYYIYPEVFGAPPEKQIEWVWNPQLMKRMRDREKSKPAPTAAK